MREAIIEQQINVTVSDELGNIYQYEDVSAIIFDGRDAIIKCTDKCLVRNSRLFDVMTVKVVDRQEPKKEPLSFYNLYGMGGKLND